METINNIPLDGKFTFGDQRIDFREFYHNVLDNVLKSIRNVVVNQPEDSYQIIGLNVDTSSFKKTTDRNIAFNSFPNILLSLILYLPPEQNRLTSIKLYNNKVDYFSLPYPHRYFEASCELSFGNNSVYTHWNIERVSYAITAAHKVRSDDKYRKQFIGAWLPNHDGGWYCGNKQFSFTLRTPAAVENPQIIEDQIDEFFQHFYNSTYNSDLISGSIGTPSAAYICSKLPVRKFLKTRLDILDPYYKTANLTYLDAYDEAIKHIKQHSFAYTSPKLYLGYTNAPHLILSMADALQENQDFWEKTRYKESFNPKVFGLDAYCRRKFMLSRFQLNQMLVKKLSKKVDD